MFQESFFSAFVCLVMNNCEVVGQKNRQPTQYTAVMYPLGEIDEIEAEIVEVKKDGEIQIFNSEWECRERIGEILEADTEEKFVDGDCIKHDE